MPFSNSVNDKKKSIPSQQNKHLVARIGVKATSCSNKRIIHCTFNFYMMVYMNDTVEEMKPLNRIRRFENFIIITFQVN